MEEPNRIAEGLLSFVAKSPSPFHAVKNVEERLLENSFARLSEGEKWKLEAGGKYFAARNGSSLIAFELPTADFRGFLLSASHSDSPCFKVKENPELSGGFCVRLNVEKYGGMLMNPWFDRPLSIAGRVAFSEDGRIGFRLVDFERDLLMIPSLAIHFARDANDGHKIDLQGEMMPVISSDEKFSLLDLISEKIGILKEDIKAHDLFLYSRSPGVFWGEKEEFIASPRLDDLECVFSTLNGFLNSSENRNFAKVFCVFDNEEVGSGTRQGADSTFLEDTLRRINLSLGRSEEEYLMAVSESFLVSADNAHALHPNFQSKSDLVNRPRLNGGVVIKYNAAQKYTTDALSSAFFKCVCERALVPFQVFTNNSNVPGGSTLGNISTAHVSTRSVDVGLAQWAMHSPFESAGKMDVEFMQRAMSEFFSSEEI